MREIGGEFWEVPVVNKHNGLFLESTQWYISGRSALQAIIAELGVASSVSLPSWCCESIIKPFVDAGFDVHFYPVYWQDGLKQEIILDSDVLFLMDFFGYIGQQPDLKKYEGIVIRDITHSLFSTSYNDADYYFGSLRKWCGVCIGGYAWAKDGHRMKSENYDYSNYVILRNEAMSQKAEYINWKRNDKGYLKIFEEAENFLENVSIVSVADKDVSLVDRIDVNNIGVRRRANAEVLRKHFSDWLVFTTLTCKDVPMFVPILVPNGKRDSLQKYLIDNEIYCPNHWPISEYHTLDEKTIFLYKNELSLVCDQRYNEDDMNRMVEVINTFMMEE